MLLSLTTRVVVAETGGDAGAVRVSLRDCVQRALERNTDLKLKRVDVVEADVRLQEERGTLFFPKLTSSIALRRETNASPYDYMDNKPYDISYLSYGASLGGLIPVVTGTSYELSLTSGVTWTDLGVVTLSPRHINVLQLSLTQPLLRGWGRHTVVSKLEARRVDHRASMEEMQQEVSSLLLKVAQAYWRLVTRQQEVAIATEALALTEKQRDLTRGRVQIGTLSALDLSEAEAEVEARRQELVGASIARVRAEKELLLLYEATANSSVVATEQPAVRRAPRSYEPLVTQALRQRPELRSLELKLKAARLRHGSAKNQALPKLDLTASVGAASLSGDENPNKIPTSAEPNPNLVGGHDLAYRQIFTGKLPFFQVGLTFELPLSGAARSAEAEKMRLAVKRLELEQQQVRTKVALEVRDSLSRLHLTARRLEAAINAVDLARANLELASKKFLGGLGTPFDVLRGQTTLTRVRRDLAQVREERGLTSAELQAALGSLPSSLGVELR